MKKAHLVYFLPIKVEKTLDIERELIDKAKSRDLIAKLSEARIQVLREHKNSLIVYHAYETMVSPNGVIVNDVGGNPSVSIEIIAQNKKDLRIQYKKFTELAKDPDFLKSGSSYRIIKPILEEKEKSLKRMCKAWWTLDWFDGKYVIPLKT